MSSSIHIRGVDAEFVKRLKREALEADLTLKDYVLSKLVGGVLVKPEQTSKGPRPEPEMVPPPKPKKSCPHGNGKDVNCWLCGGKAKIE